MIYLIGSMRNPAIPDIANALRAVGHEVFDDWYSPGPEADDYWQKYEHGRARSYKEALASPHAAHVFAFDYKYLQTADTCVLALPAGKSAHIELGWMIGQGKRGYVLFDKEPERYDIMYKFATGIFFSLDELLTELGDPCTEGVKFRYTKVTA